MTGYLAIDSNLTLLLAVGRAEKGLVARHKHLRPFNEADYELLQGFLVFADEVVTTPNALTEVSNIATYGIAEPARSRIVASLQGLIGSFREIYHPSTGVADQDEFARLGLADCAWLSVLDRRTRLLTVDNDLYLAALNRGCHAVNFHHARIERRRD